MTATCQIHGAGCTADEIVDMTGPDGWSRVTTCWDGYAVMCEQYREDKGW